MRSCICPSTAIYPNITIVTTELTFNITPQMYLIVRGRECYLGLDQIDNSPSLILGDLFLHHHQVIFDKQKNRIGFINNNRSLIYYVDSHWKILVLDLLSALIVAACAAIVFCETRWNGQRDRKPLLKPTLS